MRIAGGVSGVDTPGAVMFSSNGIFHTGILKADAFFSTWRLYGSLPVGFLRGLVTPVESHASGVKNFGSLRNYSIGRLKGLCG